MENSISFTPPRNRGQGDAGESEREVQTEVDIHIRVDEPSEAGTDRQLHTAWYHAGECI
ncbi:MAG: hypothetical protein K2I12_07585 [Duncaniella sp.]|nr:hypothetical protein [Duncaniella sp.]